MRYRVSALFAIAGLLLAPVAARADAIDLSAALSANFLDGKHDTGETADRIDFVPLPLASLDARWRAVSVHLEALPAVTFGYGPNGENAQSTRLSILNPAVRYALTAHTFVGVGQTIYNQATYYDGLDPLVAGITREQYSRVTGIRYEAGQTFDLGSRTNVVVTAALNPAMQGLEYSVVSFGAGPQTLADPESATQIDASATIVHHLAHGDFFFGVRYLNYSARYRAAGTPFDGKLSDRNVGLLPLAGYRVRL
jgi:hypothetical protein